MHKVYETLRPQYQPDRALRNQSTFDTIHWIFIRCTPRDDIIDWVWIEIMFSIKNVETAAALTLAPEFRYAEARDEATIPIWHELEIKSGRIA